MSLKLWDGSEFVDPAQVKVWDGAAYAEPDVFEWDADAEEFVKLWPTGPAFVFSDDFNRSDTSSTAGLGSDWWNFSTYNVVQEYPHVSGNRVRGGGGISSSNYTNGAVVREHVPAGYTYYAELTWTTIGANPNDPLGAGFIVRANESSDHNYSPGPGQAIWACFGTTSWRVHAGMPGSTLNIVVIGSGTMPVTVTAGARLRVEVHGDTLLMFVNGAQVASVNVFGYGSGRQVGVYLNNNTHYADDFEVGTIATIAEPLISDMFNRPNTSGSTGLGSDWWNFSQYTYAVEYPYIDNYRVRSAPSAYYDANQGNGAVWKTPIPAGVTDYYVQVQVATISGERNGGLILRANESANGYGSPSSNEAIFCVVFSTGWRIYRHYPRSSGTPTVIASGTGSFAAGKVIRAEVRGDTLTLKYDGTSIATASIAGYGSGRQVGLHTNGTGASFDNFEAGLI